MSLKYLPLCPNTHRLNYWLMQLTGYNVNPLYETDESQNNTRLMKKAVADFQQVRELTLSIHRRPWSRSPCNHRNKVDDDLLAVIGQITQTFVGIIVFMAPKQTSPCIYHCTSLCTYHSAQGNGTPCK